MPPRKKKRLHKRKKKFNATSAQSDRASASNLPDSITVAQDLQNPLIVPRTDIYKCSICVRAELARNQCRCTVCTRSRITPNFCQCTICQRNRQSVSNQVNYQIKRIPSEIWSIVWPYLPPKDLSRVMQTYQLLHDSVAPSLYRRIIISDPSQLFEGLNHHPKNGRLSKLHMIGLIKNLPFAYDIIKVPQDDQWIDQVTELDQWESLPDLDIKISQLKTSVEQLKFLEVDKKPFTPLKLFPKLKTVSFGYRQKEFFPKFFSNFRDFQKESRDWKENSQDISTSFRKYRSQVSETWMKSLERLITPLHTCREVGNGPLGYGFSTQDTKYEYANKVVPHTITCHFSNRHLRGKLRPNLIFGTLNRWILEDMTLDDFAPRFTVIDVEEEEWKLLKLFRWVYRNSVRNVKAKVEKSIQTEEKQRSITRIRIYSNFDWIQVKGVLDVYPNHTLLPPTTECQLDIESHRKDEGVMIVRLISPVLVENRVTVELMKMEDAGTCPACGTSGGMGLCPSN